ncbi:MAG: bifunctional YncE family protein/alkaline phosphatase family protein [Phycisphaerales bacterium]
MVRLSPPMLAALAGALVACVHAPALAQHANEESPAPVGPAGPDRSRVTTGQFVEPAGETIEFAGRPIALVLSPDGRALYAKDNRGIVSLDPATLAVRQELKFKSGGGSLTGIAVSKDSSTVFATTSQSILAEARVNADGTLEWTREIQLPPPKVGGVAFPCGIAISPDGATAAVCLSRNNSLGMVDLGAGTTTEIPVGVAPFDVLLSADGKTAFVSLWGGEQPPEGTPTAPSAGTPVAIDARGVATSGGVGIVDVASRTMTKFIATGLSTSGLALSADGARLFVANSNSDRVTVIDTRSSEVVQQIVVKPDEALPFGSMPCGLACSATTNRVYVSCAGNNAVAVIDSSSNEFPVIGWIPSGWYPTSLTLRPTPEGAAHLLIANTKGVGSRTPRGKRAGFNSHGHRGSVQSIAEPAAPLLAELTAKAKSDARVPQVLRSMQRAAAPGEPVPVPAEAGGKSVHQHVVYVIKENRTFDQVFGDIGKGNADPSLCVYGRDATPNQHAMAERWVLLDNFYCNGVLSADGHTWATEGNVTPYLERAFGGFARAYTFGDDPLSYSSTGFIWDHVLAAGLSFRNYGEFDYAGITPAGSYDEVYRDWTEKAGKYTFTHNIGVENVRRYSNPEYPGWNMDIPDVYRAEVFLKELETFKKEGSFPNFVVLYLPNNHGSGVQAGVPTPRSLIADNDLALGRIVEGLSNTEFWKSMVVFVVEDDPQDGFDHVDGHRSPCLVMGPYVKRGEVVSNFYNQTSVLHTMERILGITAPNQLSGAAPIMDACFTLTPDFAPFQSVANKVPLNELTPKADAGNADLKALMRLSSSFDFSRPDACDEDAFNRVHWHAAKGMNTPYPAEWAGSHGNGLGALGLKLDAGMVKDDEDDEIGEK